MGPSPSSGQGGGQRVAVRVFRWAPGGAERWQAYTVGAAEDTTVLDALVEIQRRQDATLAFRYACRVGMCGSCGMVVNGRERWACRTRLATVGNPVEVRPLYHLPVLRDLVVDMGPFTVKLAVARAALEPVPGAPAYATVPPGSRARQEADAAIECIGCAMCLSACTMVAYHPRFPGPAALNRAWTLELDDRDAGRDARWRVLLSEDALWRCHGQASCTEVCPMGLSPTASITGLRRRAVRRSA